MSDSRFHIKVKFEIYGESFDWDASLNWYDNGEGIDQRIVDFFSDAHNKAYAKFQAQVYEYQSAEMAKQKEAEERAELARLSRKYKDGL